jgi:hypothetical protein
MAGAISQPRQRCQFPFLVDEKPAFVPGGSAAEQSGGARKISYGVARSNSGREAPSACVGKRFSAVRLSGIDRLDAPAHGAGARVGRPRWLRILTITGGSSMAAMILNHPFHSKCSNLLHFFIRMREISVKENAFGAQKRKSRLVKGVQRRPF